jgi:hypothetical protein
MRGTKAKAIARIADQIELRVNKHGAKQYQVDKNGTLRVSGGFSLLYRLLKKTYKKMNINDVKKFREECNDTTT